MDNNPTNNSADSTPAENMSSPDVNTSSSNSSSPQSGASQNTRTLVTILVLIFFWPAGIILMWVWSRWKFWVKILITSLSVVFLLLSIIFISALVYILVNPKELERRARDSVRITNLAVVNQAIQNQIQSGTIKSLCGTSPAPCIGESDKDGTGWLKVPVTLDSVSTVPVDPLNDTIYHYTYCSDGKDWEMTIKLESPQNASRPQDAGSKLGLCSSLQTPPLSP